MSKASEWAKALKTLPPVGGIKTGPFTFTVADDGQFLVGFTDAHGVLCAVATDPTQLMRWLDDTFGGDA